MRPLPGRVAFPSSHSFLSPPPLPVTRTSWLQKRLSLRLETPWRVLLVVSTRLRRRDQQSGEREAESERVRARWRGRDPICGGARGQHDHRTHLPSRCTPQASSPMLSSTPSIRECRGRARPAAGDPRSSRPAISLPRPLALPTVSRHASRQTRAQAWPRRWARPVTRRSR